MNARQEATVTWENLLALEPRLADLLADAQAVTPEGDPNFCANEVWSRILKPQLKLLVGWFAESADPALHSTMPGTAFGTIYIRCQPAEGAGS